MPRAKTFVPDALRIKIVRKSGVQRAGSRAIYEEGAPRGPLAVLPTYSVS